MLIYVTKDELDEIYKALMLYYHNYKDNSRYESIEYFLEKRDKIEDLLNKITYECMYYS